MTNGRPHDEQSTRRWRYDSMRAEELRAPKYTGAKLRQLRAEQGVGKRRQPKAQKVAA